ncbi:pyridoxal phosphate-dependent aminotransferase [bacterium]|nr:pyridoxal phosphate-dependent aminotransferase [bacterium]
MVFLSERSRNTPPSPIRRLSRFAREAKARGVLPYALNIGQPDLECPASFQEGVLQAASRHIEYAPSEGFLSFREAWAEWCERELAVSTDPDHYLVTVGASEGLVFLFTTCCDPGDEIIIFDPTYANYMGFAEQTGVRLVSLSSRFEDGFQLPEPETIRKHITSRTRAILLCNPNNPTGVLYGEEEVQRLLDLCHRYGLYLLLDETYREIVYDQQPITSALKFATEDPHVVVVDSLSKRFSLCGARIGTLHVPSPELREKILSLAQARLAAPTLEQQAAEHMLRTLPPGSLEALRGCYQARRDCLLTALQEKGSAAGISCCSPSGAFYLLAKLPVENAEEFARFLLTDYQHEGRTVFLSPAKGFYSIPGSGEDEVRIAFVLQEDSLRHAVEILVEGLSAYRS